MHHLTFSPLAILMLLSASVSALSAVELMIAHPSVPNDEISADKVEDIYLGRFTTWKESHKVVVVVLESGESHEQFLRTYLQRTPSQFSAFWKKMIFTGKGKMPTSLADEVAVVEFVRQNKGAIAYISDATPHDGVKVLNVR